MAGRGRTLKILFAGFVLFSLFYSFKRYHYFPVDGDLPAIVMQHKSYQAVMHDPFGLNVLLHDSAYPAPNRFFAHLATTAYFLHAPSWFRPAVGPVNSVYYACALAKTFFHFFIACLLAVAITGSFRLWSSSNLAVLCLLLPLFQVTGYNGSLGIIDSSITYSFFYAGAFSLVMLFMLPSFLAWHHGQEWKLFFPWMLLSVIIVFNGPLNAAVIAVLFPPLVLLVLWKGMKDGNWPRTGLIVPWIFVFLLALYSLYLGTHNAENRWDTLPVAERYRRLPHGLEILFTGKLAWPLLLLVIIINSILVYRHRNEATARRILSVLGGVLVFSILYIAVLPLGGYRSYRPDIVRIDTLLPVTLAAFLYYGLSTYYLFNRLPRRSMYIYTVFIFVFLAIFFNADLATHKFNTCERNSLEELSVSPGPMVKLEGDCPVLSWRKTTDPAESEIKCEMLMRWGILKEKKLFYQE